MQLCDYHLHSDRSTDGHDSLMKICAAAVRAGMTQIAVTDHFEPTRDDPDYAHYGAEESYRIVTEARRTWHGLLEVRFGVELGHPHLYPASSERLVRNHPFDFVLASGHKMVGDTDFSEPDYARCDTGRIITDYLDNLEAMLAFEHFDCLGHFDLPKRYAARDGVTLDLLADHREQVVRVLCKLIRSGRGLEINTSGWRQLAGRCLPDADILCLYRSLGGTVLCTGSDAHRAEHAGEGIARAAALAHSIGFEALSSYRLRVRSEIPLERIEGVSTALRLGA